MNTVIIEGLNEARMTSYLNARQYEALYWPTLFPLKPVDTLDGKTLIGSKGSRMLAHVVSYNSKSPESTRKSLTKKYFDIPKTIDARVKDETEIIEYAITRAMRGNDAVVEDYFNDVDYVYDSCMGRAEWFALQAINKTKIKLTTVNNPKGIVNEEYVDFGMPTANKKCVAVIWSTANAATMTPITDFKNVVKAARAAGVTLTKALMNPDDFDLMIASTEFLNAAKSLLKGESDVVGFVGLATANAILSALRLPTIVLVETVVGTTNPFEAGHVTFIPQDNLGEMYSGPIASEIVKPANAIQAKRNPVLIQSISEANPPKVTTTGECNIFPSWPTVDRCYSLYLSHASTWA